ncbi:MAG: DUF3108 domain-containing protein [Gemmataceae bacterium]|nr:DUF3108 domain-containing protein [Gemmataceae bacterium]
MRQIALWIGLSAMVWAAPVPKDVKVPDYFPIQEGGQWTYAQSSFTKAAKVISKNTMVMTLDKVESGKESTRVEMGNVLGKGAKRLEEFEVKGTDIICRSSSLIPHDLVIYKKGAKVGDKWEGKISYNKTREGKAESVVEPSEEVTVPAGTYKCVVVSHKIEVEPLAKGAAAQKTLITLKFWLADGVGIVKRERTFSSTPASLTTLIYELQEFTPKKKNN